MEEEKLNNLIYLLRIHHIDSEPLENLIKRNKELEEKYKRLSIEAQATAFDDQNRSTEILLRVLLKQGEIELNEKDEYQRKDFDWEENLYQLGLMKKREKTFYLPDEECLDEYTKQLESQLKEYNEAKEIFSKYYVMGNDTLYDGCIKMQDEIDELKEKNKELEEGNRKLDRENQALYESINCDDKNMLERLYKEQQEYIKELESKDYQERLDD